MSQSPDQNDVEQSVRRVRRGCFGVAAIFAAMSVMLISSTGNLFYSILLLIAIGLVVLSRQVR